MKNIHIEPLVCNLNKGVPGEEGNSADLELLAFHCFGTLPRTLNFSACVFMFEIMLFDSHLREFLSHKAVKSP
jgi:hypothetical protein